MVDEEDRVEKAGKSIRINLETFGEASVNQQQSSR
jgi:hypothetical protein